MVISWPVYQCDFICDDIQNTHEDRSKYFFYISLLNIYLYIFPYISRFLSCLLMILFDPPTTCVFILAGGGGGGRIFSF